VTTTQTGPAPVRTKRKVVPVVVWSLAAAAVLVTLAVTVGDWKPESDDPVDVFREAGIPVREIDPDIEHWKKGIRSLRADMVRLSRGPTSASGVERARRILEGIATRVRMIDERQPHDRDLPSLREAVSGIEFEIRLMEAELADKDEGFKELDDAALLASIVERLNLLRISLDRELDLRVQAQNTDALRPRIRALHAELARKINHVKSRKLDDDLVNRFALEVLVVWSELKGPMRMLPPD